MSGAGLAVLLAFAAAPAGPPAAPVSAAVSTTVSTTVTVAPGIVATPLAPLGIRVEVEAKPGESWAELARRSTGHFANAEAVHRRDPARLPVAGRRYAIPFELLTPAIQKEVMAALLPLDRCQGSDWVHVPSPRFPADGSFEELAAWFAGGASSAASLEVALRDSARREDGRLKLPCVGIAPWLADARGCCAGLSRAEEEDRAEVAAEAPATTDLLLASEPAPSPASGPARPSRPPPPSRAPREATSRESAGDLLDKIPGTPAAPSTLPHAVASGLTYSKDGKGAYASYRLKAGEAIYSAVIARFTGRVHARDVNDVVPAIAERSDVRSFARLRVGFEVKIPLELLAPEYLPHDDAKRREWEQRRAQVAQFKNRGLAPALEGVAVILDAGHGGRDRGAMADGVWESDYVYDIVCRIKRRLEKSTRAKVLTLVKNETLGYAVSDRRRLQPRADSFVLTRPPYRLEDPVVGVNLRWYLANSLYRQLLRAGTDPGKIVFTSIHADSLHPDVSGSMVYVPAEEFTGGRHARHGPAYDGRREVREEAEFSFTDRERQEAEGLSRELAARLLEALAGRGLPVHADLPIRGSVLRNHRQWLPAVLRSNRVPTRVLLEVCNLNHDADNRLLESPAFRQSVADAYVEALLRYYGNEPGAVVAEKR